MDLDNPKYSHHWIEPIRIKFSKRNFFFVSARYSGYFYGWMLFAGTSEEAKQFSCAMEFYKSRHISEHRIKFKGQAISLDVDFRKIPQIQFETEKGRAILNNNMIKVRVLIEKA